MSTRSLFVVVLCMVQFAAADIIVTRDGTLYKGMITAATDSTITITDGALTVALSKEVIIAVNFTHSDIVILQSGEEIIGKVTAKEGDDVVIATPAGVQRVKSSSVEHLRYNASGEIKVPELPRTGKHFTNAPEDEAVYRTDGKGVYAALQVSNHYAALDDWKNQFTGGVVQTQGFLVGIEAGYELSGHVIIGAGYEGFSTPTVEVRATSPTFDDHVTYSFAYGSLLIGGQPSSSPETFIYGGVDAGLLTGTESIAGMNGVDFDGSGDVVGFRPKAGVRYRTGPRFGLIAELGYLSAKVDQLKVLGTNVPNYSLDFSGVFYRFGVSLHLSTTP